jgi:hypothetical protein
MAVLANDDVYMLIAVGRLKFSTTRARNPINHEGRLANAPASTMQKIECGREKGRDAEDELGAIPRATLHLSENQAHRVLRAVRPKIRPHWTATVYAILTAPTMPLSRHRSAISNAMGSGAAIPGFKIPA